MGWFILIGIITGVVGMVLWNLLWNGCWFKPYDDEDEYLS